MYRYVRFFVIVKFVYYFFMILQLDKLPVPLPTSSTAQSTKDALLTTSDVTSMMTVGMAQMKTRLLVVKN